MDEWMDRLREQTGDVRPAGEARDRITQELGRRRRRRHGLTAVGAVAAVAFVVAAGAVVPRLFESEPGDPGDPATSGATSDIATEAPDVDPAGFACPLENPVFTEDPPMPSQAIVNAQKRTYSEVVTREFDGFAIHRVEVFVNAGVFALVTGDLARAEDELGELGVAGVGLWDPSGPEVGLDEQAQLEQMIQWKLEPILRDAQRQTQHIRGEAAFALWKDADAILVLWQEPVPDRVRALEDIRYKSGGSIIVRGVTYSAADIRRAQRALNSFLDASGPRLDLARPEHFSMSTACGDFSGLVVGLTPDYLADADVGALQTEFAQAIGMPAYVVPEEKPRHLLPHFPED